MNETKPANEAQRRLFFALCNDGGFDSEKMKERAKVKYGLEHFTDITSQQISELIDKLQNKVAFAGYQQATDGESPPEPLQPKEKKYTYKFSVFVLASHFKMFREVLDKISKGITDVFGDEVKADARIPIGTISVKVTKELSEDEIKGMSARLETEFKAKISIPSVVVEAKKDE